MEFDVGEGDNSALSELVRGSVLDAAGPVSAGDGQILINSVLVMLVIVVPTIAVTVLFAWWFRASNQKARYRPDWSHSGHIELIVWGIPLLVVFFLSGIIWIGSHELDPGRAINKNESHIPIDVVSLDWKWVFIYRENLVASLNELVLPVNTEIHLRLTSGTVMNMFFIPQLGSMISAMNGMESHLHLKATRPGLYPGLATQFSGEGFSDMKFLVKVVSDQEYRAWLSETMKSEEVLNEKNYLELALRRSVEKPRTFGSVDPTLFRMISSRAIITDNAK